MLKIVTAHRQEALLQHLAASLGPAAGGDPLAPDLLVAERGMDRWLFQFLAETHGIAANLHFEPPAGFVWRLLRQFITDAPADSRFDRAPLAWRIARLLPRLLGEASFAPLATYLADDDGRKRHQLSGRIAGVFTDYLVYRPDMVLGWEAGRTATSHADERWQMALWRAVVAETGTRHRAALLDEFLRAKQPLPPPANLPARAAVFGIPALPPTYVQALVALGNHLDLTLYVLTPCNEYWGDLGNPGQLVRLDDGSIDGTDLGNRLLAAWGQPVRHFISELYGQRANLVELDAPAPAPGTLLHRLQHDIRTLAETPAQLSPDDDSLHITSAFGPLREVEILHDALLDRFGREPALTPRDVLVMVPDLEQYAPAIEAVFGAADGARHIPWSITDLPRRAHPLVATVEQLLRLPDSRFAASEVLGLLETPAIARRVGLDPDALGQLRQALRAARLHGDLDAASRAARGLPADAMHTWQFALQRLFLGVAMHEQPAPVLGVLPEPAFEGQAAALLGSLQAFIDRLAHWQRRLARAQVPDAWLASLHALFDDFLAADDDEQAVLDDILKAGREFLDETNAGDFGDALAPLVFRDDFLARLRAPAPRGNLRTGAVVFCGMVPMRSVPFRVIALLGMNAESFPRQQRAPGFDLITLSPRPGDRARRHDDRHLLLETLLSARDALYISYTGRSLQDDSAREPSVLVRELIDQVVATHGGEPARKAILEQILVQHPLQPFSRRYFLGTDARLFSHDSEWLGPAQQAAGASASHAGEDAARRAPFCAEPLPLADDMRGDIELDRLARFFENPARGFLRERFGIGLYDEDDGFDDNEPFALDGLAAHALRQEVLGARLAGEPEEQLFARLRARGDLPQAKFGELAWQRIAGEVAPFVTALTPLLDEAGALDIDLMLETPQGPRRLHGRLPLVSPALGQVVYQVSSLRDKHLLSAWVRHLALLATAPDGIAPQTLLVSRGDAKKGLPVAMQVLGHVDEPRALLARLVTLFDEGRCAPLPLLPSCSRAWAEADDDARGRAAASRHWAGDDFGGQPGERDDEAVRIVFGDGEPPFAVAGADAAFAQLARGIFTPLLAALGKPDNDGEVRS
jgi:exodeoxyribonuclease V gamma subunit